jgi:hypothetical protein
MISDIVRKVARRHLAGDEPEPDPGLAASASARPPQSAIDLASGPPRRAGKAANVFAAFGASRAAEQERAGKPNDGQRNQPAAAGRSPGRCEEIGSPAEPGDILAPQAYLGIGQSELANGIRGLTPPARLTRPARQSEFSEEGSENLDVLLPALVSGPSSAPHFDESSFPSPAEAGTASGPARSPAFRSTGVSSVRPGPLSGGRDAGAVFGPPTAENGTKSDSVQDLAAQIDDGSRRIAQTVGDLDTSLARLFETQIESLQRLVERALEHERRWVDAAAMRRAVS